MVHGSLGSLVHGVLDGLDDGAKLLASPHSAFLATDAIEDHDADDN